MESDTGGEDVDLVWNVVECGGCGKVCLSLQVFVRLLIIW